MLKPHFRICVALLAVTAFATIACVDREPVKGTPSAAQPTTPPPPPPPPAPPPEPPRVALTLGADIPYNLVAVESNKCVQPVAGSTTQHASVEIATCNGSKAQQFHAKPVAGGYHTFVNVSSNMCLDVEAVSPNNGARVQQFGCNNGPNQQWIIADGGTGTLLLVARHSGKAMDVASAAVVDGAQLIQWVSKSSPNQQFKLKAAEGKTKGAAGDAARDGATGKGSRNRKVLRAGGVDIGAAPKPAIPTR